jgi:hypothetical protein
MQAIIRREEGLLRGRRLTPKLWIADRAERDLPSLC